MIDLARLEQRIAEHGTATGRIDRHAWRLAGRPAAPTFRDTLALLVLDLAARLDGEATRRSRRAAAIPDPARA